MGLASSQARMLLLTARKSDLEYRAQMISQRKINLAMQTQDLATKYSQALQNRTMQLNYATVDGVAQYEKLSYAGITAENANYVGSYIVKTASGKYAVTDTIDALKLAAKLESVNGAELKEQEVIKYKSSSTLVSTVDLTYSTITKNNYVNKEEEAGDYVVKTAEGKYAVANTNDALAIAAKLESVNGTTVDTTKLTAEEKTNLLAKYEDKFEYNAQLNSTSYFQSGLKDGSLILAKAVMAQNEDGNTVKTGYENVSLNDVANLSYETETRYVQKTVDLSAMTDTEKQTLLNKYKGQMVVVSEMNNADYFQDALRNGGLFLQKLQTTSGKDADGNTVDVSIGFQTVSWSSCGCIADKLNTEDDAQAEAEYEAQSLVLANQDKMLDLELNQVETQHKAIETEYDSVKKVIEKNIDISYKIFA